VISFSSGIVDHFRLPFAFSFTPGSSPSLFVIFTGQVLDGYGRGRIASGAALPEPDARPAAILGDELDPGRFQRALHGLNSSRWYGSAVSLELDHG
jgi:hypothetical protein